MREHIAIIGAGLSGLSCARVLADAGAHVTLFEKARGVGGRMSTRRADAGAFDHGAQYFTAREPGFQALVAEACAAGTVAPWTGRIGQIGPPEGVVVAEGAAISPSPGDRYVGVPGMSAFLRWLAADLTLSLETRVVRVARPGGAEGALHLSDEAGRDLGAFDRVVITVPPVQAVPLLTVAPALAARVAEARLAPCWAVMVGFDRPLDAPLDGAFFVGRPVSWAARDSSKPGRAAGERWVVHGHWQWSEAHLEDQPEDAAEALLAAFFEGLGVAPVAPSFLATHRWRYALPVGPLPEDFLYDTTSGVGVCGDWCNGPRVEGAWLSGRALATAILADLGNSARAE